MMETKIYTKEQIEEVVNELSLGKVIAFPTDTVFGLGVVYDDKEALYALKHAKIRPETKPIPMMVSSLQQIEEVAYVSDKAKKLIRAFMPGAFTIVLKRKESIPSYITNDLDTIAIRMPDDVFVLELMERLNKPMLVSSANISEQHSCSTSEEVMQQLDGRIDGVVCGKSKSATASTIVSAIEEIKILREGEVTIDMIQDKLKEEII